MRRLAKIECKTRAPVGPRGADYLAVEAESRCVLIRRYHGDGHLVRDWAPLRFRPTERAAAVSVANLLAASI